MKTNLFLLSVVALSLNSFASDKGVDRRQDLLIEAQQMDKEASAKKNTVRNQQEINDSVNNSVKTYEIEEVYGGEEINYSQTVDLQENVNHYELSRLNIRNALARIYNIPLETEEQQQEWSDLVDQTYFDADAIIAQAEVDELEKKEVPNFHALLNQLLNERLSKNQEQKWIVEEDLEFLRENITTMEVNTARLYNWDVERRKKEHAKQ